MLRMAADAGTTDIVATPHADPHYTFQPDQVEARIAELLVRIGSLPRIHGGCDFHLSFDNIQDALANPAKYTIAHRNYILVEFSDLIIFNNTTEIFNRLLDTGLIPEIGRASCRERVYVLV